MTTRELGNIGEDFVCSRLSLAGFEILERNFTIKGGEIDIIAKKGEIIAFVEVKARKRDTLASGYEAITRKKIENMTKAVNAYLTKENCQLQPRFDSAILTIHEGFVEEMEYIENSFDATDLDF